MTPWVRYPTVLGSDVAGQVVAVGTEVTRLRLGDRVVGYAAGQEKRRNSAAEGGFQHYVTLLDRVTTKIPDEMPFERAAVLPLGLATAAAGLFERDQLALPAPISLPTGGNDHVVLVWGASTSVGCNAVQLGRASGFAVLATAGAKNHDLVRSLGAEAVFDYREAGVDQRVVDALQGRALAGTIAIGHGSLSHALRITTRSVGAKRIASAYPDPITTTRALLARARGIRVSSIWGGSPVHSPVGPAVFQDYLPDALADGRFRPAPDPVVAGQGLPQIPEALGRLRAGVSATKIVITLEPRP